MQDIASFELDTLEPFFVAELEVPVALTGVTDAIGRSACMIRTQPRAPFADES